MFIAKPFPNRLSYLIPVEMEPVIIINPLKRTDSVSSRLVHTGRKGLHVLAFDELCIIVLNARDSFFFIFIKVVDVFCFKGIRKSVCNESVHQIFAFNVRIDLAHCLSHGQHKILSVLFILLLQCFSFVLFHHCGRIMK